MEDYKPILFCSKCGAKQDPNEHYYWCRRCERGIFCRKCALKENKKYKGESKLLGPEDIDNRSESASTTDSEAEYDPIKSPPFKRKQSSSSTNKRKTSSSSTNKRNINNKNS